MTRRLRIATTVFAVVLAAAIATAPLGAQAFAARLRAPAFPGDVLGASMGLPRTSGAWGPGDTWYDTWAADGNIYATSDDSLGFNGRCHSNIVVNELTGTAPAFLASPYANCMTSYGVRGDKQNYRDGRTWKTDGVISVDGTLYVVVARQVDGRGGYPGGYQSSDDASIVKSADNGRTWSNGFGTSRAKNGAAPPRSPGGTGAKSMFRTAFTTPQFINYGKDDNPASTADGANRYVYAISTDGWAYDGSYMILGRVLRSKIGRLNAADWQFYTGSPGGNGMLAANWSGAVPAATHIISAAHQLSQASVTYIPGLRRYVLTSFYFPFNAQWPGNGYTAFTTWAFYQAPHPWGPWTLFYSHPAIECYFSCDLASASPIGLYDPALVPKFEAAGGLTGIVFTSGDFVDQIRPDDQLYRLHEVPVALTTTSAAQVVDDTAATYSGQWSANYDLGLHYQDTAHFSAAPGAVATFSFTGDSIAWVGEKNNNHGYASVSIDGGTAVLVDTYAPTRHTQQLLYQRTGLAPGPHTITITVTSQKRPAATNTYQDVDAFIIGPE
jgi:hypothetical protein